MGPPARIRWVQTCAGTLTSLTLRLSGNRLGDAGASALAALADAPALQSLTLLLCFNDIGDSGAHRLATFSRLRLATRCEEAAELDPQP